MDQISVDVDYLHDLRQGKECAERGIEVIEEIIEAGELDDEEKIRRIKETIEEYKQEKPIYHI